MKRGGGGGGGERKRRMWREGEGPNHTFFLVPSSKTSSFHSCVVERRGWKEAGVGVPKPLFPLSPPLFRAASDDPGKEGGEGESLSLSLCVGVCAKEAGSALDVLKRRERGRKEGGEDGGERN